MSIQPQKSAARPRSKGQAREHRGRREKKKQRTKEQILAAALQLFRQHGLEGTTTKQISKKAGIAEGTLFNYFKTKEDLALFFFQKETNELIEWFKNDQAATFTATGKAFRHH